MRDTNVQNFLNALTEKQRAAVLACKTEEALSKVIDDYDIDLPDEMLEDVAGGKGKLLPVLLAGFAMVSGVLFTGDPGTVNAASAYVATQSEASSGTDEIFAETETTLKEYVSDLQNQLVKIYIGRADPCILNQIEIYYYGDLTDIGSVASVSVIESDILVINPWDASMLQTIEKAITRSDIGIKPLVDGNVIKLVFPKKTPETMALAEKEINTLMESTKIKIRNARRDALKKLTQMNKEGNLSESAYKTAKEELEMLINHYNDSTAKVVFEKKQESMK